MLGLNRKIIKPTKGLCWADRKSDSVKAFIAASGLPEPRKPDGPAPEYAPECWNEDSVRVNTNCYGYALNLLGEWVHIGERERVAAADTLNRRFNTAVADGLIPAPFDNPPDIEGYYQVALVDGHGWHWYRKDSSGLWSHKDGPDPVTNLDDAGALITDPKTAQVKLHQPYNNFISYFYVPH